MRTQSQIQGEIAIAHKIEATFISLRQGGEYIPLPDLPLEELIESSRVAKEGFIGAGGRRASAYTLDPMQLALLYAINLHKGSLSSTVSNLAIFMPQGA